MTTIPMSNASNPRLPVALMDGLLALLAVISLTFLVGVAIAVLTLGSVAPTGTEEHRPVPNPQAQAAPLPPAGNH